MTGCRHQIGSVAAMAGRISMGASREVLSAVAGRYRSAGRADTFVAGGQSARAQAWLDRTLWCWPRTSNQRRMNTRIAVMQQLRAHVVHDAEHGRVEPAARLRRQQVEPMRRAIDHR